MAIWVASRAWLWLLKHCCISLLCSNAALGTSNAAMSDVLSDELLLELSRNIDPAQTPASEMSIMLGLGGAAGGNAAIAGMLVMNPRNALLQLLQQFASKKGRGRESALELIGKFEKNNLTDASKMIRKALNPGGEDITDGRNVKQEVVAADPATEALERRLLPDMPEMPEVPRHDPAKDDDAPASNRPKRERIALLADPPANPPAAAPVATPVSPPAATADRELPSQDKQSPQGDEKKGDTGSGANRATYAKYVMYAAGAIAVALVAIWLAKTMKTG